MQCIINMIHVQEKFQREFRARLRFIRILGGRFDDSIFSEASGIDKSKIRASYRFSNNRCYSPHLHNSLRQSVHRVNGSNSHKQGMKTKQYKCNNNNHHLHNLQNPSHSRSPLLPHHQRNQLQTPSPPPSQENLYGVLENGVVRATNSLKMIEGTNLDMEHQGLALPGPRSCHTNHIDNVYAQHEKQSLMVVTASKDGNYKAIRAVNSYAITSEL